jgi:anti-sigma regulatory factor (Ser/Thr protein kinase)
VINQPVSTAKLFLAQLTLPVHRCMVRIAVDSATQVGSLLSFSDSDRYNLDVAVEEAFCNAVDHFSGPAGEGDRIHVEFFVEEDSLIVSIREKGIPFDLQQADRYTPDSLETTDLPGLGMLLMQQGMDSVELFVHGREGKETRLVKKIKYGALPLKLLGTKPIKRGKKRPTVKDAVIRPPEQHELAEVCRLAWRCYGYTQEDLLYDLDLLTKKFLSGEFKPVVAFDPASGAMIGHGGLKYHDPKVKVSELGLAFVDPAYRCPGLSARMGTAVFDIARENGDAGVFDCSVTTHTFSQKGMQEFLGSRPCSLLMGIAASGMQAKELATSEQEKGSVMNHYFAFDRSPGTIYVSPRHQAMVDEIYHWLELPREFGVPEMEPPPGESAVSVFPLPDELNVAFIIAHTIGTDTVDEVAQGLRQCKRDCRDAVYAFLPLGVSSSPYLVEQCERLGFSFAGIMPHIHDGDDRILMQHVSIPLDPEKIRLYGDMSRKLFSYILEEKGRIEDL